jgi:superfamily I DNA/RNA helicase
VKPVEGIEYNSDGSIKWGESVEGRKKEEPYILTLRTLQELPFPVGKKLVIDVLQGKETNKTIKKHNLDRLFTFGSLCYNDREIYEIIDTLEADGFIQHGPQYGKPWKVLTVTSKGKEELDNPKYYRKQKKEPNYEQTNITEEEGLLFEAFNFFLKGYNEDQKKAIVSSNQKLLCIAGAGSGKTTVLTKRIEFLIKFRSVPSNKILAITFTRKARMEMQERLTILGIQGVAVETFNSFCEKILKKHNNQVYGKTVRMMSYSDKMRLMKKAFVEQNITPASAIDFYFKTPQIKSKTSDQLFNIFMNDMYFIIDYFKSKGKPLKDFSEQAKDVMAAKMAYALCSNISKSKRQEGLRTHMDQIVDTLDFLKMYSSFVPEFDHVLVDEYQDVNDLQIELLKILTKENLFSVGDPRQSIFGWRGSNISYILNFKDHHPKSQTVNLKKNYRSTKHIVNLMNEAIRPMSLPALESIREENSKARILQFKSEEVEFEFIIQRILVTKVPREEIFVLARTNRQLKDLAQIMNQRGISFVLKGDDSKRMILAQPGQVTLATVHAIKGLEATVVFVIGATYQNYPCRGSEHPVVDMIKVDEYNKEEEERRLFYVALSRAKEQLYISYAGRRHTYYITNEMKKLCGFVPSQDKSVQRSIYGYKIK